MTTPETQTAASKPGRRRFQYSLKHLLIGTAVVALVLGIWVGYIRKAVDVRKAVHLSKFMSGTSDSNLRT